MKYKTQSVLIPQDKFNKVQADRWIMAHGYKLTFYGKKVHITDQFFRYRQMALKKGQKKCTFTLPNGVKLIRILTP